MYMVCGIRSLPNTEIMTIYEVLMGRKKIMIFFSLWKSLQTLSTSWRLALDNVYQL